MMIHANERVRHAETCMQDRFRPMAQPTCSCYALHAACACVGLCASNIAVADQLMRQRPQRKDHGLHLPAAAALQPMVFAPVESARRASGQDAPVRRSRLTQILAAGAGGVRHCHSHVEAATLLKSSFPTNSTTAERFRCGSRHHFGLQDAKRPW